MELNSEQQQALVAIREFVKNDELDAFILRGSAGTGKTTLIAKLYQELYNKGLSCALLAPTGRAARILGNKIQNLTNCATTSGTVHSLIYLSPEVVVNEEATSVNDPAVRFIFPLKEDESPVPLLIIDESSMVGDKETHGDLFQFGSGKLLKDIISYIRINRAGRQPDNLIKVIFVGDNSQLPPVGENFSPALSDSYLTEEYQLKVKSFELHQVMRQEEGSHVLDEATKLKNSIADKVFHTFSIHPNNEDIFKVSTAQALDFLVANIKNKVSSAAVVYSNAMALEYNSSIRQRLWGNANLPIQVGDLILINKNSTLHALNNGDLVKVIKVAKKADYRKIPLKVKENNITRIEEIILSFRFVTVAYRTIDGIIEIPCRIIENLLHSPNRELTPLEQRALYVDFLIRNGQIKPKSPEFKQLLKSDSYYNALQIKYGYAMTCHKAQGGEWDNVLVDFTGMSINRNSDFYRWTYTAITRTSKNLYLVSAPEFSDTSEMKWSLPLQISSESSKNQQQTNTLKNENCDNQLDDKFKFEDNVKLLIPIHKKLIQGWQSLNIGVDNLQHLQYCERYTLSRAGNICIVQYFYNGKFQLSRFNCLPCMNSNERLTEDVLSVFLELSNSNQPNEQVFIEKFIKHIDEKLAGSGIKREKYQLMPYRLRIIFSDAKRRGEIDFNFNKKQIWTSVQEVGTMGSTNGLYEEIQKLMTVVKG